MVLVLRPVGRGNWAELRIEIQHRHIRPMNVRAGDRVPIGGIVWRVVRVLP